MSYPWRQRQQQQRRSICTVSEPRTVCTESCEQQANAKQQPSGARTAVQAVCRTSRWEVVELAGVVHHGATEQHDQSFVADVILACHRPVQQRHTCTQAVCWDRTELSDSPRTIIKLTNYFRCHHLRHTVLSLDAGVAQFNLRRRAKSDF